MHALSRRNLLILVLLYGSPLVTYAHGPSLPTALWKLTGWFLASTLVIVLVLLGIGFCLWLRASYNRSNS
jgi:hypothetical protein